MTESPVLVMAMGGSVFGVDATCGMVRWEHRINTNYSNLAGVIELLVEDDIVLACGEYSNELYCISYPNGELIGKAKLGSPSHQRPVMLVDGDRIYISRLREVECFNRRGEPLWKQCFDQVPRANGQTAALAVPGKVRQTDDAGRK